ncbi:hypothetical protein KFK09_009329 [Dendrobium nobile]|uniref:Uncharacterized protein n=1 Tax=Dendrobium nobile TaxID=94219 RepID=A0A8T3BS48_DENNO|nr:hypothetical protein KFK09_009329 [Dendrobium nobile]
MSTVDWRHRPLTVQIDQLICSSLVHLLDDEGTFPIGYEFATNFSVWNDWSSQHHDKFSLKCSRMHHTIEGFCHSSMLDFQVLLSL